MQVGVGTVVTSGILGGVMVSTLAQNARDVGSIPILSAIFPILSHPREMYCVAANIVTVKAVLLLLLI